MKRHQLSISVYLGLLSSLVFGAAVPLVAGEVRQPSPQDAILVAQARGYDRDMARGLYYLIEARGWLQSSSYNRGGLRNEALTLVNEAVSETEKGIQYGLNGEARTVVETTNARSKVRPFTNSSASDEAALENALKSLESAQNALRNARSDKGGFRVKAISTTEKAIAKTRQALRYSDNPDRDPNMIRALNTLKNAEELLRRAVANKGGHRVKALDLVQQAIRETELGITHDEKN